MDNNDLVHGCKVGVVHSSKKSILQVILDDNFKGKIAKGQRLMVYKNQPTLIPSLGVKNVEVVRGVGEVITSLHDNTVLVKSTKSLPIVRKKASIIPHRQLAHKLGGANVVGKPVKLSVRKGTCWEFGKPQRGDLVKIWI